MPEIHYCTAQTGNNRVCEGYYTLEDGLLTMVYGDGNPVQLQDGSSVTHRMRPGDEALPIAKVLTKEIRSKLRGEGVAGFWDELPVGEAVA